MILKWLTRIYVLFASLVILGMTGIFLEGPQKLLLQYIPFLILSCFGLFTLWKLPSYHLVVMSSKNLNGIPIKKLIIGGLLGTIALIMPILITYKVLVVSIICGFPALIFVSMYYFHWRAVDKNTQQLDHYIDVKLKNSDI